MEELEYIGRIKNQPKLPHYSTVTDLSERVKLDLLMVMPLSDTQRNGVKMENYLKTSKINCNIVEK